MSLQEITISHEESTAMGKGKKKVGEDKHSAANRSVGSLQNVIGILNVATWTLGLAVIAWLDFWWPGIMVLVAISAIGSTVLGILEEQREQSNKEQASEQALHTARAETLPAQCPACGAPLSATTVLWRTATSAVCPYCQTTITRSSS